MLIILIVVNLDKPLPDEIHFLHITFETNDGLSWGVDSAVHSNDELIGESSLTFFEEMIEASLKLFENSGVLDEIGLHFWSDLLIELELFNNQVKIIKESLLDVFSDVVIKSWLNMEWFIGLLNFLDPHVQGVKLLFDEIIEIV